MKPALLALTSLAAIGALLMSSLANANVRVKPRNNSAVKPSAKALTVRPTVKSKSGKALKLKTQVKEHAPVVNAQKINRFNTKLVEKILEADKGTDNLYIGGPATVSAIAMLTNGASEKAQEELLNSLGYSAQELNEMNKDATALQNAMNLKSKGLIISSANAFFADQSLPIKDSFTSLITGKYKGTAQNLDFITDSERTAEIINKWGLAATDQMIDLKMDADRVKELAAVLAAAVYSKGVWETQFNVEETEVGAFWLGKANDYSNMAEVPMMRQTFEGLEVVRTENYNVARLPYAGRKASMYLIKPTTNWRNQDQQLSVEQALVAVLRDGALEQFKANQGVLKLQRQELVLPKFKISYSNSELVDIFKSMGVEGIFRGGGLLNLSDDSRLLIDKITMDSALEVDEFGSKSSVIVKAEAVLESLVQNDYIYDTAFAVVVRDDVNGVNLFTGIVRNPAQ